MSIDYAFKSKILNERQDLLKEQKLNSRYTYALCNAEEDGELSPFLKKHYGKLMTNKEARDKHFLLGDLQEYLEASKINNALYNRSVRLKRKIEQMLTKACLVDETCLFLTITFNDNCLNKTNALSRRKYVTLFLKQYCECYVANIDYGKKNHREHYHAVVLPNSKINFTNWIYGTINYERIHTPNARALAKYTAKLTNHAIKETTKRTATIYSRG